MKNNASAVLFRRMPYYLSPQFDIYEKLGPLVREKRVLEVGFGTGIGVLQYAHTAKFTIAIEVDEAAVRFARRCFVVPNVLWEQVAIEEVDKGIADFVVMIEVLEHVDVARHALKKVSDALRPGGQALITVPNRNRERKIDDPLVVHEWDHRFFIALLMKHFDDVRLLDFELHELADSPFEITATPLIALCS